MDELDYLAPELLSRYSKLKRIGQGGMGKVFRALDTELDRHVAIKVLDAGHFGGGGARLRFLEEARICSQLQHPNVVRLYDFGAPEGSQHPPYMIFEFVRGASLHDFLRGRRMSGDEALAALEDIARGLECAHASGITHRDLKPENILVAEGGDGSQRFVAKVADFGLAKARGSDSGVRTQAGLLLGTPPYMSPEYIRGEEPGPSSDLYALAVIAFEMLTGALPFLDEDPGKVLRMHLKEPAPDPRRINPSLCDALADLLMETMAKAPGDRPPDMSAFLRRLQKARERQQSYGPISSTALARPDPNDPARPGSAVTGRRFRVPAPRESPSTVRRQRWAIGLSASVVVMALVAAGLAVRSLRPQVRDLRAQVGPHGALVRWSGSGSTSVRVRARSTGAVHEAEVEDLGGGRYAARVRGLAPGITHDLEVRDAYGLFGKVEGLELETMPDTGAPQVELALGDGGAPRLRLASPYPAALTWWIERETAEGWTEAARGGEPGAFHESLDLPLADLEVDDAVRLWSQVHPVGASPAEPVLQLNGQTPFSKVAGEVFAEVDDEGYADAWLEIEDTARRRSAQGHPTPDQVFDALVRRGAREDLPWVAARALRFLRSPRVPLVERALAEAHLWRLGFVDALLEGHGLPAVVGLVEARPGWLPTGNSSTLRPGAEVVARWDPGTWTGGSNASMYPSQYERLRDAHGLNSMSRSETQYPKWLENDRKVHFNLKVDQPLGPTRPVELRLSASNLVRRYALTLTINGVGPMLIWSLEAGESNHDLLGEWGNLEPNYYRLPPGVLKQGPNSVVLGLVDVPGPSGFAAPIRVMTFEVLAE